MAPPMFARKAKGRRKIDMKFVKNDNARFATFSKRKVGIFNKATELSTLCAAQIAIIIFSVCGKAHSFGHPNLEWVLKRYHRGNSLPHKEYYTRSLKQDQHGVKDFKEKIEKLKEELENSKDRRKWLDEKIETSTFGISEEKLRGLDLNELKRLKEKLKKCQKQLRRRARGESLSFDCSNGENVNLETIEIEESEKSDWLKL